MNYEERYNELIDAIKELMEANPHDEGLQNWVQDNVPELTESEDEKIRKELLNFCKNKAEKYPNDPNYKNISSWIAWLEKQVEPVDKGEISDGFHTFNELYYYRMLYNAAFFNMLPKEWVHKSKKHNDGEECFGGGWFIVMANLPTGQISNHYELKDWDLFQIPEKERADKWDGHTPQEAAERLHKFLLEKQVPFDEEKMRIGARKDVASSIITYLDRNTLGMCLSNMECEDIENAVVDSDWGKVYDYMKKKLEQQDESKVSEPNWCHHKVDLSAYSEEYRKAYYDGWNNCNIQHSQCNEERNDVVKCLINGMKSYYEDNEDATWGTDKWSMPVKHIIEVLEKQGEHKSVDKVEPKFQNGQWVVWQNKCYKVNYNGCGYELIDQNGLTTSCEYGTIDENAHLWTIEDAKDGDVLIVYGLPFIYCCFDDYQGNYCCIDFDGVFRTSFDFGFNGKTILPATKEQRDILFSKMKEAGYMWDAEKKELFTTCLKMVLNEIWKRRRKNNR